MDFEWNAAASFFSAGGKGISTTYRHTKKHGSAHNFPFVGFQGVYFHVEDVDDKILDPWTSFGELMFSHYVLGVPLKFTLVPIPTVAHPAVWKGLQFSS